MTEAASSQQHLALESGLAHTEDEQLCELIEQRCESARTVLRAYRYAVERAGADLCGYSNVIDVLMSQHAEPLVIAAAMLVPLRRSGLARADELDTLFGPTLVGLVERARSKNLLRTDTEAHRTRDLWEWLESMAGDTRVVTLRAAFRLVELEQAALQDSTSGSDTARLAAQETLDLYVPLVNRLGMKRLCRQLEDVCFRLLQPSIYQAMAQAVEPAQAEDDACLALLTSGVQQLLERHSAHVHLSCPRHLVQAGRVSNPHAGDAPPG